MRKSETAQDGGERGSGRADESDQEVEAARFLYGGCLFGAGVVTNGPSPACGIEEEQTGFVAAQVLPPRWNQKMQCAAVGGEREEIWRCRSDEVEVEAEECGKKEGEGIGGKVWLARPAGL